MNQKEIANNKIQILEEELKACDNKISAIRLHQSEIRLKIEKIKKHITNLDEVEKKKFEKSTNFKKPQPDSTLDESLYS